MSVVVRIRAWPRVAATGAPVALFLAGGGNDAPYHDGANHYQAGVVADPRFEASLSFTDESWAARAIPQASAIGWMPDNPARLDGMAAYYWRDAAIEIDRIKDGVVTRRLTGTIAEATVAEGRLVITCADLSQRLDKAIATATFAGTGGIEGGDFAIGRVKRRNFGLVWNIEGRLLDKANNIYEFGDPAFALQGCTALRDKGRAGTLAILGWQGSMAATFAALQASVPVRGGGVFAPSIACAKWWTQPSGPLTADLKGEAAGYSENVVGVAAQLLDRANGPAIANQAAAQAFRTGPAGLHIGDANESMAAALDRLLQKVTLIWTLQPTGEVVIREWTFTGPVESLNAIFIGRERTLQPVHTRKVGYRKNEREHGDGEISIAVLAGDVVYEDGTTSEAMKPAEPGATNSADPSSAFGPGKTVQDVLTEVNGKIEGILNPPDMPGIPTLGSRMKMGPDQTQLVTLRASWTAAISPDVSGYVVRVQQDGFDWIEYLVGPGESTWEGPVSAHTLYRVQIASFDWQNNRSSFTLPIQSITTARDTTAPGLPTGITAAASLTSIFVEATAPADADLDAVEIWENATSDTGTRTLLTVVKARPGQTVAYARSGLGSNVTRYYWMRAVDTSGNLSGFTAVASATTPRAVANDIADGIISNQKLFNGLAAVETVAALPSTGNFRGRTIMLQTDGKLYRWNSTATTGTANWSAAVATGDLTGQIISTQITDNAITTPKIATGAVTANEIAGGTITGNKIVAGTISGSLIAANAITASKMLIGDTSNMVPDPSCNDLDAWTVDGSTISIVATGFAVAGQNRLSTPAQTGFAHIKTAAMDVEPGASYYGKTWSGPETGVSINVFTRVEWYALNAAGVETYLSASNISASTATTALRTVDGIVTAPATARRARLVAGRDSGNNSNFTAANFIFRKASSGELIVDGAILAQHLSASSVTANAISAGAVIADKIAANAVTTAKINTGAVTANEIAANAVTTAKINTGAVTANEIASNAVTAQKVAANAITGDKIDANTVTARNIIVADLSNLVINNWTGGDLEGWTWASTPILEYNTSAATTAAGIAGYVVRFDHSAENIRSTQASCSAGEKFYFEIYVFRSTALGAPNSNTLLQARFEVDDGSGGTTAFYVTLASLSPTQQWIKAAGVAEAPANAKTVSLWVRPLSQASPVGRVYLGRPVLRRAASAELIVNGAITADKMAANSITAANGAIQDLTVQTLKIANQAVNTVVSTFTAAQIATTKANDGWVTAQTASVTTIGAAMNITMSAAFNFVGDFYGANGLSDKVEFRALRDGNVIWGPVAFTGAAFFNGLFTTVLGSGVCTFTVGDVPSVGAHTYQLQFRTVQAPGESGTLRQAFATNRGIFIQEIKK
ncbi:hypothetical protein SAMN02927924_01376 [Sphingobium faniae]|nr:hypothetical protein SAMN02927924_01376 [Sphingobium faniae]